MDRIALIGDIHANIVALKAVLSDIESRGISRIFCLGDVVLKGSSPCETLDLVRDKCEVVLKGNCDDYAVKSDSDINVSLSDNKHRKWYNEKLGKERIEYLNSLPMYKDFYFSGSLIRLFHASKDDLNFRIGDTFPIEEKLKLFEDDKTIPNIVVYADIHKQYLQKIQYKTLLNIGSVGNPLEMNFNEDEIDNKEELTQAYYCILEGYFNEKERKTLGINFVRVPYDIEKELELAKKNNIPDYEKYELEIRKGKYRGKNSK